MARRSAPVRLTRAGGVVRRAEQDLLERALGSTRTRSPRGSVAWTAPMPQCQPRPGASAAAARGVPIITASAPHATARAMSPPVVTPPSAMTWQ